MGAVSSGVVQEEQPFDVARVSGGFRGETDVIDQDRE
jgi:hypothetical protein